MKDRLQLFTGWYAAVAALFIFLAAGAGRAQSNSDPATYPLQGTVINSLTSEPIARALVEIRGQSQRAMLTDSEGRFDFGDVLSGTTTVAAEKPGFLGTGDFKGIKRNQLVVEVGPNGRPVTLPLVPEGLIVGQLQDQDGAPIEGAVISLFRNDILAGRKRWQRLPANATSDAEGNFRFAELGSGLYCIAVHTTHVKMPFHSGAGPAETYLPVSYYPESPTSPSSSAIELAPGEETHIQLSLAREPVFRVIGSVIGAPFAHQLSVQLLDSGGETMPFPIHSEPDGRFQIDSVVGGTYLIRNEMQDRNRRISFLEQSISVTSNITSLQIPFVPPISIPVDVRLDSTEAPPSRPCVMKVDGRDVDCSRFMEANVVVVLHPGRPFEVDTQSSFHPGLPPPRLQIGDVQPGEYSVSVSSSLGYVDSVTCGGVNLLRESLIVQAGVPVSPIHVILRDDAASVSGSVRSEKPFHRAFVLLAPDFAPLQSPVVIKTNSYGGFAQGGLAPGEYRVFAFDTLKDVEYGNPDVLSQFASEEARTTLSARQGTALTLNLIVTQNE